MTFKPKSIFKRLCHNFSQTDQRLAVIVYPSHIWENLSSSAVLYLEGGVSIYESVKMNRKLLFRQFNKVNRDLKHNFNKGRKNVPISEAVQLKSDTLLDVQAIHAVFRQFSTECRNKFNTYYIRSWKDENRLKLYHSQAFNSTSK